MEDRYLPIYVLTGVFGAIFIFGPLFVPKSQNRELIRACIMMTAFCCWILWVTMYIAQMNPLVSPRVKNTTLAYLVNSQKTQSPTTSNSTGDADAEATEAPATQEETQPIETTEDNDFAPRASEPEFGVPKALETPTTSVLLPVITTTTQPPTAPLIAPPTPTTLTASVDTDDVPVIQYDDDIKPPVKLVDQGEEDDKVRELQSTYDTNLYL